jgi:hypothetical protein
VGNYEYGVGMERDSGRDERSGEVESRTSINSSVVNMGLHSTYISSKPVTSDQIIMFHKLLLYNSIHPPPRWQHTDLAPKPNNPGLWRGTRRSE